MDARTDASGPRPQIPHYRDLLSKWSPDPFWMADALEVLGNSVSPGDGDGMPRANAMLRARAPADDWRR
ncbi:MAG: hypothetical protein J7M39_05315, partial [Anaerolineae bacterium]|nr:hypothetical protein [Anaerolineae bacterium]